MPVPESLAWTSIWNDETGDDETGNDETGDDETGNDKTVLLSPTFVDRDGRQADFGTKS